MQTERLLVVVLLSSTRPAEVNVSDKRDAFALATKFQQKQPPRKRLQARSFGATVESWKKFANGDSQELAGRETQKVGKHHAIVVTCIDGEITAPDDKALKKFFGDAKTCGAYVLMHGSSGIATPFADSATSLAPRSVAATVLKLLSFAKQGVALLKVNVCACTLAQEPSKSAGGKFRKPFVQALGGQASFAAALCAALARPETMVAGYVVPMYVGRDNNPEFNRSPIENDQLDRPPDASIGRKAALLPVDPAKPDITRILKISGDNRATAKRVYRFSAEGAQAVSIEDYHAYGR